MTDDDKSLGDDATLGGESPERDIDAQSLGDQSTHGDHSQMDSVGDSSSLGDQLTFAGEGAGEAVNDDMEIVDLESRYTIEGVLGKGGMGEVLLATDTRLERKVAIKRILGKAARSKTAVNRFLTEAKSVAALNHPNIVQVYDYGRDKQGPFLIMEYVAGESLLERCKHGAIGLEEAIELTVPLCDGLAAAHDAHIIHRDIKPANILLTSNGIPKLTDFGLAKAETADTGMTMAGAVLGTHDFMPPEQRKDAALVDARSDLWSLAATLYQMLTGETPRVIDLDAVPRELRSCLAQALKTNKDDRYQTAGEMGTALRECLTVSAHLPVTELGSGECPSCHTRNEANRKFCSECAGPLRAPCFGCESEIPVWDKVCGECGSNQHEKVKQLQEERAKQRAEVEQLLQASEFDKATQQVAVYRKRHDPRVDANNNWADEMVARIDEKRESELKRIAAIMEEAKSHQAAFDYGAGLRVLKQVPSALMARSVTGLPQTPQDLSDELTQTAREIQQLQKIVQERLANKEYDGLLETVEQLQALQPNRPSLNRIQEKLSRRQEKLRAKAEDKFEKAKDLYEQQQYDECSKTLQQVNTKYAPRQFQELNTEVNNKIHLNQQLRERITTNVKSYNHQGETLQNVNGSDLVSLLSDVDQFLQLQPDADEILAIRDQLETEKRNFLRSVHERAYRDFQQSYFPKVAEILVNLHPELMTGELRELLGEATEFDALRRQTVKTANQYVKNVQVDAATETVQSYLDKIGSRGVTDEQIVKFQNKIKRIKRGSSGRQILFHPSPDLTMVRDGSVRDLNLRDKACYYLGWVGMLQIGLFLFVDLLLGAYVRLFLSIVMFFANITALVIGIRSTNAKRTTIIWTNSLGILLNPLILCLPFTSYAYFTSANAGNDVVQQPELSLPELAEQGDADAQYNLGYMYNAGEGVTEDKAEAVKWYTKAAEQDHAGAQNNLGLMYARGEGVTKDPHEAFKWFTKAAEQGDADAQNNLGLMYARGEGVTKDPHEAVKWYTKAAEQKNADAQYNLGIMYEYGEGVTENKAEAFKWFTKAAEQGNAYAQTALGYMYEYGEGVTEDLAEAVKWYTKAAEQDYAPAQNSLGFAYKYGEGVTKDLAEAFKWFTKAAEQDYATAQYNLGFAYKYGEGVPEDKTAAFKWFTKAAEQGNAYAQTALGYMYEYGEGVTEDLAEAVKWYTKAAKQDYARAQNNLGLMYAKGVGVTKDNAEAFKWYTKAAKQDYARAQNNLGLMYAKGVGVTKDNAEAFKWFTKAAEQGDAPAQYNLGNMYEYGEGVTEDKAEAVKWYTKAAEQGEAAAKKRLEEMDK